jgi:hypothetical protein
VFCINQYQPKTLTCAGRQTYRNRLAVQACPHVTDRLWRHLSHRDRSHHAYMHASKQPKYQPPPPPSLTACGSVLVQQSLNTFTLLQWHSATSEPVSRHDGCLKCSLTRHDGCFNSSLTSHDGCFNSSLTRPDGCFNSRTFPDLAYGR